MLAMLAHSQAAHTTDVQLFNKRGLNLYYSFCLETKPRGSAVLPRET